jgi:hypothetical protein
MVVSVKIILDKLLITKVSCAENQGKVAETGISKSTGGKVSLWTTPARQSNEMTLSPFSPFFDLVTRNGFC